MATLTGSRSVVGGTTTLALPPNFTSPTLIRGGSRPTNRIAPCLAAPIRLGSTSRAIITVARSRGIRTAEVGWALPSVSRARATNSNAKVRCRRHPGRLGAMLASSSTLVNRATCRLRRSCTITYPASSAAAGISNSSQPGDAKRITAPARDLAAARSRSPARRCPATHRKYPLGSRPRNRDGRAHSAATAERRAAQLSPGGTIGAGRVLLEGNTVRGPGGEHGTHDAPRLFSLIAADREGSVAVEHVQEQPPVSGQRGRFELGREGQGLQGARVTADAHQLQDDAFWFELEPEHVRLCLAAQALGKQRKVWHRPKVHGDFHPIPAECLAGA